MADVGDFVVRIVDPVGAAVSTFAGTAGVRGTADGPPGRGQFASLRGLVPTADGTLFVADGARIRRASPDGTLSMVMTLAFDPESLAGDGNRLIAVGDRMVVAVSMADGPRVEPLMEARRGWRDGPSGDAGASLITSVVVTPEAFYLTDAGAGRIRRLGR